MRRYFQTNLKDGRSRGEQVLRAPQRSLMSSSDSPLAESGGIGLVKSDQSPGSREGRLRRAVDHAAHLLPMQGPIGVFVHHNTLHAFQDLPFEQAVIEASHLFGTEPYMSEAAYRAELARGRIHLEDIDAVLDREPDALVFPRLSRRSLRRAMMTPGVREFDAATIMWRAEQGDLARDFRQAAAAVFVRCVPCPYRSS